MQRNLFKIGIVLFLLLLCVWFYHRSTSFSSELVEKETLVLEVPRREDGNALKSLFLRQDQCAKTFPGLAKEITRAVGKGRFVLKKLRDETPGLVQGRIKDGKLYIISADKDNELHRITAILHSLHRAIITSPTQVPDTVFAINTNDLPHEHTWSFARSDDDLTPDNPWLMPHYSSWSWPISTLGPLDEVLSKIDRVEAETGWEQKIDKAVWRGTPVFNPDWDPRLRAKLVEASKGKDWADVQISGPGQNSTNTIQGEDFCRYAYLIYAEGKSYSGRLPYHQACASVIITPPLTYLLHTTHLLRPVFSSQLSLTSSQAPSSRSSPHPASYPHPSTKITWPKSYPPHLANIVFVAPDWSDLEETIAYLRTNPEISKGIAGRQRELMMGGGYMSEAAEVCYWRSLVNAWSLMATLENDREWGEGMRWETFSVLGRTSF